MQRARTKEQIHQRHEMILKVTEELYQKDGLAGVTFTTISKQTSFTRQAIYKYYQTREEVLLDLLDQHYQQFMEELSHQLATRSHLTTEELAGLLTQLLLDQPTMLSLFSILYSILEEQVSHDRLFVFKEKVFQSFTVFYQALDRLDQQKTDREKELFAYHFILLLSSIYPITHPSELPMAVIRELQVPLTMLEQEEICLTYLRKLLS